MTRKFILLVGVGAVLGAVISPLVLRPSSGVAARQRTVTLERGDFARVPSIGWTCMVAHAPNAGPQPVLLCTSDRKPIKSIWVSGTRVFVDTGHAPAKLAKGYAFR